MTRGNHQRLTEEIEGSVKQDGRGSGFSKAAEKASEQRADARRDDVQTDAIAREEIIRKSLAMLGSYPAHIGHEASRRREIEIFRCIFFWN